MSSSTPKALTIAGSDSGGGAGIQADIKTFTALKVYGMSVITSVTAQNTEAIMGISDLDPDFVGLQIDAVMQDMGADSVKVGMLSNEDIIKTVAGKVREYSISNLVLDPVMRAKGGGKLLKQSAEAILREELLPLAFIVTPNLPEVEALTGKFPETIADMKEAAEAISSLGPRNVLIKGGHLASSKPAVDVLFDGDGCIELQAPRIETKNTHGTGCTLSAAICAYLAKGAGIEDAVREAKGFLTEAIKSSFEIGRGRGPLNHMWKIQADEVKNGNHN